MDRNRNINWKKSETIDKSMQKQINGDGLHQTWVLLRIIYAVKILTENNLTFCGDNKNIHLENNHMIAKFDPTMKGANLLNLK